MMRRSTTSVALLGVAGALLIATPTQAATSQPRVTLTGKLVQLADQKSAPSAAVQLANGTYVPISATPVKHVASGAQVTVTVAVPAPVRSAAANDQTVSIHSSDGSTTTTHLDGSDLAAASDATPESAASDIGRATTASAAATGDPLTVTKVAAAADPLSTYIPATRHLYVALVTPKGYAPANTVTPAQVSAQVAGASNYWSTVTGGGVTLDVAAISEQYVSAYDCSDPWSMWNEAAAKMAFPDTDNTTLVVELPTGAAEDASPQCSYGLGTVGSSVNSAGSLYVADDVFPVLSHELGHNMSLRHANYLQCAGDQDVAYTAGSGWGDGCQEVGYGDGMDVMSASPPDFAPSLSMPQALRTGMVSPDAQTVITATGTTAVTLLPVAGRTGLRAAQIVDPNTGVAYYVEYRTPAGLDAQNVYAAKMGVRVLRYDPDTHTTVLLDPTPSGQFVDYDPELAVGQTFTSYSGGVTVTNQSQSASSATLSVTVGGIVGPPVTRVDPTLTIGTFPTTVSGYATLSGTLTGSAGAPTNQVIVRWDGHDASSANVVNGKVSVQIPPGDLGSHTLQLFYPGDAAYNAASSATVTFAEVPTVLVGVSWAGTTTASTATVQVAEQYGRPLPAGTTQLVLNNQVIRAWTTSGSGGKVSTTVGALPYGTSSLFARSHGVTSTVLHRTRPRPAHLVLRLGAVHPRRTVPLYVTVTAPGVVPTGTVGIYAGTRRVAVGTLRSGTATLVLPATTPGKRTYKLAYGGSSVVLATSVSFAVTTPPR